MSRQTPERFEAIAHTLIRLEGSENLFSQLCAIKDIHHLQLTAEEWHSICNEDEEPDSSHEEEGVELQSSTRNSMCPLATIKNLETRCTIPALKTALGRLHLAGVLTQHIAFRESENKSGFFSERADKLTMLTEGVKLLREAGCLLTQEVSSDLGHVTLSLAPLPNIQTAGVLARHTGETRTLLNQYQAVGGSVVLPDSVDHALSTEAIERLGLTVTDVVSVPYKNG